MNDMCVILAVRGVRGRVRIGAKIPPASVLDSVSVSLQEQGFGSMRATQGLE